MYGGRGFPPPPSRNPRTFLRRSEILAATYSMLVIEKGSESATQKERRTKGIRRRKEGELQSIRAEGREDWQKAIVWGKRKGGL